MESTQNLPTINIHDGISINKSWLALFFILIFPFIVALPRGVLVPFLKVDEIVIVLIFSILIFNRNYLLTKIDIAFFILFLSGTLLPIIGIVSRAGTIEWMEIVALIKPYFVYRIVFVGLKNKSHISKAILFLLLPSTIVAALALLQLIDTFGVRSFLASAFSESSATVLAISSSTRTTVFRATSTLGQWNTLGGYASLGACLSFALAQHRRALKISWLAPLFFAINLIILSLAGSSSSIIGFLIGILFLIILRPQKIKIDRRHLLILFFVIILSSVIFISVGSRVLSFQIERQTQDYIYDRITRSYYPTNGIPASVLTRWLLAKHLLEIMSEDGWALLTGFGSGSMARSLLPWGSPESGYVGMYFFYGLFFLLSYLWLLWILMRTARATINVAKNDELGLALSRGAGSFVVVMFVINFIGSYYVAAGVMHYFWIVFGLVAAYLKIHRLD